MPIAHPGWWVSEHVVYWQLTRLSAVCMSRAPSLGIYIVLYSFHEYNTRNKLLDLNSTVQEVMPY